MKAITILLILFFFSAHVHAISTNDTKIDSVTLDIILDDGFSDYYAASQDGLSAETKLTRLYMYKDSRIKKALTFAVRNNLHELV